jgi:hypothetical protein
LRRCGDVDVERQMLECVGFGRGVGDTKFEYDEAAIEQRQRAGGVLAAKRRVKCINGVGWNSRALCTRRVGGEREQKDEDAKLRGVESRCHRSLVKCLFEASLWRVGVRPECPRQ